MPLFDDIPRTDRSPRYYAEPYYKHLNRSASLPAQRVRELLETWLQWFPEFDTSEWRGRFQSEDDRHHVGALFELYCRALLDGHGSSVTREPAHLSDRGTMPDFLVYQGSEPLFVMECTIAAGPDFGTASQQRLNQIYDILDRLHFPNFFIGLEIISIGPDSPPTKKLRAQLKENIGRLDPDDLMRLYKTSGMKSMPHWTWKDGDWELCIFPIPKKPEYRGKPGARTVGLMMTPLKELATADTIRKALQEKLSHYGQLSLPYVVAINALDFFTDDTTVADALFGDPRVVVNLDTGFVRETRAQNGFWCGPQGPQSQRVSAVLIVRGLVAGTIASAGLTLWHNPWADLPLDSNLWQGSQMLADSISGTMRRIEGKSAAEILGIAPNWPGFEEDEDDDEGGEV